MGETLQVPAGGVLGNDSGSSLWAALVDPPGSGTLDLQGDGSFTFTPEPSFNGTVNFTYVASDGNQSSNTATMTIKVNAAPVAAGDSLTTPEDTPLTANPPGILGNDFDADGDALLAIYASGPAHGVLTLLEDGSFTYTPNANYAGDDQFTYQASDGLVYSNLATVAVSMTPDIGARPLQERLCWRESRGQLSRRVQQALSCSRTSSG